jgi:Glycosyltransferase family 28 C-terminal domain
MTSSVIHMACPVLWEIVQILCNTSVMSSPSAESLGRSQTKRIHVLFHDAGGGHRNAAVALNAVCEAQSRSWEINLVQFQDLTDHLDVLRRLTGIRIQEQYNILLRNGWTRGSEYLLRVLQLTIRILHKPLVKLLANYWRENPADLLISVIPHFNRQIAESWNCVYPGRPFVTIITDIADFPPHFWIEPLAEQVVVTGSERAVQQARDLGKSEARNLFRASGMILRPDFYTEQKETPRAIRKDLGLDPELQTAIVLFGGYGSNVMYDVVEQIEAARLPLQMILVCGKNEKLADRFREKKWNIPLHIVGFSREVNRLMHAADFLIGKAGPGSIAEAMISGLPVLVERNAKTLPQERYNTEWVTEKQVGTVIKSFRDVVPAVRSLLELGKLSALKCNVMALHNGAIFEIPEFLSSLLGEENKSRAERPVTADTAN